MSRRPTPHRPPRRGALAVAVLATAAWVLCAAVELAQLAGFASAVVDLWEPARWVLGTTFHAPDLLVYAVGACAAAVVDTAAAGHAARRVRAPAASPG